MSKLYTKFECNHCSAITDFLEMNTKLDADERSVLICPICESPDVVEYVNESEQMKKLRADLAAERESFAIVRAALDVSLIEQDRAQNALVAERGMRKKDISILKQSLACVEGWIGKPLSTYSLLAMENLLSVLEKHLEEPPV